MSVRTACTAAARPAVRAAKRRRTLASAIASPPIASTSTLLPTPAKTARSYATLAEGHFGMFEVDRSVERATDEVSSLDAAHLMHPLSVPCTGRRRHRRSRSRRAQRGHSDQTARRGERPGDSRRRPRKGRRGRYVALVSHGCRARPSYVVQAPTSSRAPSSSRDPSPSSSPIGRTGERHSISPRCAIACDGSPNDLPSPCRIRPR